MIDKRIFYCWFGKGKKSKLNEMCIESWKQYCPEYEIEEINETNFNCCLTEYSTEGYEKHNWSAVSNTARLEIMHNESGFYLDTDIQLFKSLDELREYDGGFITEYETGQPDAGFLGRGSKNPILYEQAREHMVKGTVMHKVLVRDLYKLYELHGEPVHTYDDGFTIVGDEYVPSARAKIRTDNTIAIHHYENSWRNHPITITDYFYPFVRVEVYVNDVRIHSDPRPIVRIHLYNKSLQWKSMKVLGRINYFFNPNVVLMKSDYFLAERIEWDKTKETTTTTTASGMVVTYLID